MDFSNSEEVELLINKCLDGDRLSQKLLYKSFYSKMLGVCMRYAYNKEEAKDLLHDGFIKVFQKLGSFRNLGSFEGWIRRIIVNNTIDQIRKKRDLLLSSEQEFILDNVSEDIEAEAEKEAELLKKTKAEIILKLMEKLSPAYRTVFNLYAIENYTHKEIAEILEINIGTSKSNYSKAKTKIRQYFNEFLEDNEIE